MSEDDNPCGLFGDGGELKEEMLALVEVTPAVQPPGNPQKHDCVPPRMHRNKSVPFGRTTERKAQAEFGAA
jgi:hypothetical protein